MDNRKVYFEWFYLTMQLIGTARRSIGFPPVTGSLQLMNRMGVDNAIIEAVKQTGFDEAMAEAMKYPWKAAFSAIVNLQDARTRDNYTRWAARAQRVVSEGAFDPMHPFDRYAAMCADLAKYVSGKAAGKRGGAAQKSYFVYSEDMTAQQLLDSISQFFEFDKLWSKYGKIASSKKSSKKEADEQQAGGKRFQDALFFGPFKVLETDDPSYDRPKIITSTNTVVSFNKKTFPIETLVLDVLTATLAVTAKLQDAATREAILAFLADVANLAEQQQQQQQQPAVTEPEASPPVAEPSGGSGSAKKTKKIKKTEKPKKCR
jgi:hypothetical protein